jgi:hypothetical protein
MSTTLISNYLLNWGLLGAAAFSLIVLYLFRSGRAYEARTREGHLKEDMPRKGMLNILLFLAVIVAFITLTNYLSLVSRGSALSFWPLFGLNLALILILVIFDSLVIDWWVIGIWRPLVLQLPEEMDREQMKVHLRRTLVVAPPISVLIALLSAGMTMLIF